MIDFGLGGGYISDDFGRFGSDNSGRGVGATVSIGYGFNNKFAIYYGSRSGAWEFDDLSNAADSWVNGMGATIHFSESAPSGFVSGVIGFAGHGTGSGPESGFGFSAGGGYEFKKNWSFSLDYLLGRVQRLNTHMIIAKINHHWY